MKVVLQRMFSTSLGRFRPDPEGVIMPDSLVDLLPSDAEIIEPPREEAPEPDPPPVKSSFKDAMKKAQKPHNPKGKPKATTLAKAAKGE